MAEPQSQPEPRPEPEPQPESQPEPAATPGPRDVFALMKRNWLSPASLVTDSLLADDAVVEIPFAAPGRPRRFQGRAQFLDFAQAARASLPVRFTDCWDVAIHDTADPEVIVVEYELTGIVTTTGHRATARFIGVLRARDGQIVTWREYQDTLAITQALASHLPRASRRAASRIRRWAGLTAICCGLRNWEGSRNDRGSLIRPQRGRDPRSSGGASRRQPS